jgi:hypothetical protein
MHGGTLESPVAFDAADASALRLLGADAAGIRTALGSLKGSIVELRVRDGSTHWTFRHPTISDAIAALIVEDPELLDVYLAGCSMSRVLQEVTCGDVGIEGVRLVVPSSRFDAFARRLDGVEREWSQTSFLSRRCTGEFLAYYLQGRDVLQKALESVHSFLGVVPSVALLSRLHEHGLLPEEARLQFVRRACTLAVETPDADMFTNPSVTRLFTDAELKDLRATIQKKLVPDLEYVVDVWGDNWDHSEDPEDYFQPLVEAFETFSGEMPQSSDAANAFRRAARNARSVAADLTSETGDEDTDYESIGSSRPLAPGEPQERSVFDDVDL